MDCLVNLKKTVIKSIRVKHLKSFTWIQMTLLLSTFNAKNMELLQLMIKENYGHGVRILIFISEFQITNTMTEFTSPQKFKL